MYEENKIALKYLELYVKKRTLHENDIPDDNIILSNKKKRRF